MCPHSNRFHFWTSACPSDPGYTGTEARGFSRLTGSSERAIAGWESGEMPKAQSGQRLREIHALGSALGGVMKPESIGRWMREPNSGFQGLKPLEVIERGEIHRVWRMIFCL